MPVTEPTNLQQIQAQLEEQQDLLFSLSQLVMQHNNQLLAQKAVLHALVAVKAEQGSAHIPLHQKVIAYLQPDTLNEEQQRQVAEVLAEIFPEPK